MTAAGDSKGKRVCIIGAGSSGMVALKVLRGVIERAMLLARGVEAIGAEHLPGEFRAKGGPFDRRHNPLTMEEVERMHIDRTLKHHGGNRTRAAAELGISRATLIAKIKRYAIPH